MSVLSDLTPALQSGRSLTAADIEAAATALLDERLAVEERANFLSALAKKGESADELAGFVHHFLQRAVRPPLDLATLDRPALDVCGTGGDKLNLFNISTTGVFVLAGAGCAVVKHGNRGITSKSGGADVLEALGCRIDLSPERFAEGVKRFGAGFMMAPLYHPAFKAIAPVRAALAQQGQRTMFNLIGPLLNPVQPRFQLVGIFDCQRLETYAAILHQLGRERAWAVHGLVNDGRGMDEFSTLGETSVAEIHQGKISVFTQPALDPTAHVHQLAGGEAQTNASILESLLRGEIRGPKRQIVLLNAAAGLVIVGKAASIDDGMRQAAESIDSGKALAVLHAWREFSQEK